MPAWTDHAIVFLYIALLISVVAALIGSIVYDAWRARRAKALLDEERRKGE